MNSNKIQLIPNEEEIKNIERYLTICNNSDINKFDVFENKKFPKVSIISPIFNTGKYLIRFLRSIQYQNFNEVEIILIDDCSSDDTMSLIKLYQNTDKRIILIKNKKNYGTFKSRNIGVLVSKGEYIILPDPDDILSETSLKLLYTFAKKYNYEMLRFYLYTGNNYIFGSESLNKIQDRPVYQPELKTYLYYATGILRYIDFNVANKFIKRVALIRALHLLGKKYLNINMKTCEDQLLNFILYRTVKSFYLLKTIGYYYIANPLSITKREFGSQNIKNIFINLKIIFRYSKNNLLEKDMFNTFFNDFVIGKFILNRTNLMNDDIRFYTKAFNKFMKNDFVSINNKIYMNQLKEKLTEKKA